jgi:hypothetical protein
MTQLDIPDVVAQLCAAIGSLICEVRPDELDDLPLCWSPRTRRQADGRHQLDTIGLNYRNGQRFVLFVKSLTPDPPEEA